MQTTMIVFGITIGVMGIYLFWLQWRVKNLPVVENHEKIITLTDSNFKSQTQHKTLLIDFWASWCAPCKMVAPILNQVAEDLPEKSAIGKVDIEENKALAQQFKIRNIPTLVLLKDGNEVARFVGIQKKDFLLKQIQNA